MTRDAWHRIERAIQIFVHITATRVNLLGESNSRCYDALKNGELLKAVAAGGFDLFWSIDKKLRYEQNLANLPGAIVLLDSVSNALVDLLPFAERLRKLLETPLGPQLYFLERDGSITLF